uniref:Uncharacterized protein n=1 Tax=Strongyloides venezuelensis TaxID=75913 RepID=A0A0K0FSB8_STRVS
MKFYFDYLFFLIIFYTSTISENEGVVVVKRSPSKEVVDIDLNSQFNSRKKRKLLDNVSNGEARYRRLAFPVIIIPHKKKG